MDQARADGRNMGRARKMRESAVAKPKAAKGSIDITFLVLVLLLVTFGLIMLFSASYANAYYHNDDSFFYVKKQLVWVALGIVGLIAAALFDYRWFNKLAIPIFVFTLLLLVIVLFMPASNGARRWIWLPGGGSVQPSEIAKFAVVVVFAKLIMANQDRMKTFKYGIVPFVTILAMVAGLMILEPHLSGTILILSIGAIMMFIGGTDLKWFAVAIIGGVVVLGIVVMIPGVIEYAASRVEHWLNPFLDPRGKGYQTIQSLYAIASGGLMGLGLGNSRQKYLYIPEPQNDFIFAIVCEELGFVGAAIIIILFALLVWRGFVIAMKARDKFGSMLAVGLTVQVGLQALLNIAVVTNTIPNTGISLPFFSYGGTSLTMLLAQMGVVLSVSRRAALEKE
ncbi:putative lipid II flippase FtsW [Hydrogenoanaerobacterium sp.]|uniref:putative lipid II flippase FtsW n=1 Tax=Hydrogenoanaerobacterium sp. TaxID=2953763 RepID=UPI00289E6DA9|nr:putative lipid II flippase FtsW [Hydrogenoanaerobacterium sp.]